MIPRKRSLRYDRRIARSTVSDPDCSGMCSDGITFGVSAMAAITSSVKSLGWGEVDRLAQAGHRLQRQKRLRERVAVAEVDSVRVHVLPQQGDLLNPVGDQHLDLGQDLPRSPVTSLPRSAGTPKVHVLLQPTLIETRAAYAESRAVGRCGERLQRVDDLDLGLLADPGPLQQHRRAPSCGCRTPRRPTARGGRSRAGPSGPGNRPPRSASRAASPWWAAGARLP